MKYVCRILTAVVIMVCVLSLPVVATEPNEPNKPAKATTPTKTGARITFEQTTHDFGKIGPKTVHAYEFEFTNTGDELLEIKNTQSTCGCTVAQLTKKEYKPGESGSIKVTFTASTVTGPVTKQVYVISNDTHTSRAILTIKANVIRKVEHEPQNLALSLRKDNAGCPNITLKCIDSQPFAITDFNSFPKCITAEIDPNKTATEFVIKPIVDVEKLEKILRGDVRISLTHPDCKSITMRYIAPPLIKADPATVLFFSMSPKQVDTRDKVWVLSNYDEDFNITSTSSQKGYFKAKNIKKAGKGRYEMSIEVTAPEIKNSARNFVDTLVIKTDKAGQVDIMCRGYYRKQPQQPVVQKK